MGRIMDRFMVSIKDRVKERVEVSIMVRIIG